MRAEPQELHAEAVDALHEAFQRVGLSAAPTQAHSADLVLQGPGGQMLVEVKAVSVADRSRVDRQILDYARSLLREHSGPKVVVLVADQVTEEARELLREQGWGYLDRRGTLWLRSEDMLIHDTALPPLGRDTHAATSPLRGRVGLGVALWCLMNPDAGAGTREIARALGAAPSTVHESLQRLRQHALLDGDGRPLLPELFDAVAAEWRPRRIPVAREPRPGDVDLELNLDEDGQGWVVGGDLGAAAWGAPVVIGSAAPPDFYVPNAALLRRAVRTLGESSYKDRGATVAVATSPAVIAVNWYRGSHATPRLNWPIAHPVVVALDLAADPSRGREILDDWTPQGFRRVW